jgi:hypothetical protein
MMNRFMGVGSRCASNPTRLTDGLRQLRQYRASQSFDFDHFKIVSATNQTRNFS